MKFAFFFSLGVGNVHNILGQVECLRLRAEAIRKIKAVERKRLLRHLYQTPATDDGHLDAVHAWNLLFI